MASERTNVSELAHLVEEVAPRKKEEHEQTQRRNVEVNNPGLPLQPTPNYSTEETKIEGVVKKVEYVLWENNEAGTEIQSSKALGSSLGDFVGVGDGQEPVIEEKKMDTIKRTWDFADNGCPLPQSQWLDDAKKPCIDEVKMAVAVQPDNSFTKEEWVDDVEAFGKSEDGKVGMAGARLHNDAKDVTDKVFGWIEVDQQIVEKQVVSVCSGQDVCTNDSSFFCHVCNYKAASKDTLMAHIQSHMVSEIPSYTRGKYHFCGKCDFKTTTKRCLMLHQGQAVNCNRFSCGVCNYVTCCRDDLQGHLLKHEKATIGPSKTNIADPRVMDMKCGKCGYVAETQRDFDYHVRTHPKLRDALLRCHLCLFSSRDQVALVTHRKDAHDLDSCKYCFHACESKQMSIHLQETHNAVPSCVLRVRRTLEVRNNGKKMFAACELCTFKARNEYTFFNHLNRIHNMDNSYSMIPLRSHKSSGKKVKKLRPILTGSDF